MVSRSLRDRVRARRRRSSGPTRRRIASNARGQSSSAPSSSPIRWSVLVSLPLRGRPPRCGSACCPCPCSRCPRRVRAPTSAVESTWVPPSACRSRPTMSMTRSGSISCGIRLADGADQRRVGCRRRARQEVDHDLVRLRDLVVDPSLDRGAEVGRHRRGTGSRAGPSSAPCCRRSPGCRSRPRSRRRGCAARCGCASAGGAGSSRSTPCTSVPTSGSSPVDRVPDRAALAAYAGDEERAGRGLDGAEVDWAARRRPGRTPSGPARPGRPRGRPR